MKRFILPPLLIMPSIAAAHVGDHETGAFLSGLGHPVGGADHVLAMVAVGLWAAIMGGRALWALPVSFVGAMLAGGLLGAAGVPLPGVEPMILASIILFGVVAALALRPPVAAAMALVALFGIFHGHAHGAEGPAEGLIRYAAGFAIATMALHLAGIGLGVGLTRLAQSKLLRGLGAATAAAGLALAFGG